MLAKSDNSKKPKKLLLMKMLKQFQTKKMTKKEINQRVNQILSGGSTRKRKIL